MTPQPEAPLHEVFCSVQGEGLWLGVPQLFVRVSGCDLACYYCDTPAARKQTPRAAVSLPGLPGTELGPNPVSLGVLLEALEEWLHLSRRPAVHSLALTGGEPLLYPAFAAALGEALRAWRLPLYLETAGHHPAELAGLLPLVDIVALDYKLPSTLPQPPEPELFAQSVALARRVSCFVKMVVTSRVTEPELHQACRELAQADPLVPLVLQPVTGRSRAGGPPSGQQLLAWQALAQEYLVQVRVIPQCHKLLGVR